MRRNSVVIALLVAHALRATEAVGQATGGSFGGSRGFGGGSGGGSSASESPSGGRSSSSGGGGVSTGGAGSGETEYERARREEERLRAEAARAEAERLAQERAEAARRERERLARELALPPSERARSDRFVGRFEFQRRSSALAPEPGATPPGAVDWWGGDAPAAPVVTVFRWKRSTLAAAALAYAAIAAGVGLRLRQIWGRPRPQEPVGFAGFPPRPRPRPKAAVRVLSVGVDWTRRREVQQALAGLAGRHDLSTAAGMFAAWQAVRAVLRGALPAVRYVAHTQLEPAVDEAQQAFAGRADDLRGRYVVETVRDGVTGVAPRLDARREEGEGLVVVSVVAGFNRALAAPDAGASLAALLDGFGGDDPEALVALETVWSPTHEGDRMSSAELEVRYPELRRLDDGVGRVRCASCKAVWARELGRCPACGAPPG